MLKRITAALVLAMTGVVGSAVAAAADTGWPS